MDHTTLKRMAGSAIVVLIATLVIAALQFEGVTSVALARLLLVCVWVLGIGGIVFSEWAWSRRLWEKTSLGLIVAVLLGAILYRIDSWAQHARAPIVVQSSALDGELREIDELICKNDENGLREAFDFPNMIKYNIRQARQILAPSTVSIAEATDTSAFWKDGGSKVDTRFANTTVVNNRLVFHMVDGRVGFVNISEKYIAQRKLLVSLYSSSTMPSDISHALKDFDSALEQNSGMMLDSLNKSLVENPRNLLEDELPQSPFVGSASGLYWTHYFIALNPKADAVRLAIRRYMEHK